MGLKVKFGVLGIFGFKGIILLLKIPWNRFMGLVDRVHGYSRARSIDSLNDGCQWTDLRSRFNIVNHFSPF
jgi:hypothetical protein